MRHVPFYVIFSRLRRSNPGVLIVSLTVVSYRHVIERIHVNVDMRVKNYTVKIVFIPRGPRLAVIVCHHTEHEWPRDHERLWFMAVAAEFLM